MMHFWLLTMLTPSKHLAVLAAADLAHHLVVVLAPAALAPRQASAHNDAGSLFWRP